MIRASVSHLKGKTSTKTRCGKRISKLSSTAVVTDKPDDVTCKACKRIMGIETTGFKADNVARVLSPSLAPQPLSPIVPIIKTGSVAEGTLRITARRIPEERRRTILYSAYARVRGAENEHELEAALEEIIDAVEAIYVGPKDVNDGQQEGNKR